MSNLLSQASLVMIPSGYKEDIVYCPVPTNGNGDLSFTRASNGTRTNSAGLVEVVAWNLALYSEDFSNGVWTTTSTTITADNTTAPNGTATADKVEISSSSNARVQQIINSNLITGGLPCTFSVYIKSVSGTGNVGIRSGQTGLSSLFSYTNQWQRFEWTFNAYALSEIMQFCNNTLVGGADSAPTFYAWGAQVNIGSTAKPYFPTTDRLNVPRLTYQNGGGGCPSLLLEKQSTNLFSYSEDFTNAYWTKYTGQSITANATTSPDGTQNADKMIDAGGIYSTATFTASTSYSLSVFIKKDTATSFDLGYIDQSTPSFVGGAINYTFSTGAIVVTQSANNSVSGEAFNFGNGWIRLVIKFIASATKSYDYQYFELLGGDAFIWGFQLEASSYPTSYIPTTSSSATRVVDACLKTGISSLIGQTEGVMFVDFIATTEPTIIAINNPANPSTDIIYIQAQIGDVWRAYVINGGVYQVAITAGSGATGRCKMAFAYKQNDFVLYANGQLILADSSGTVPVCSAFYLGYYNGAYLPIQTNQAILFPTRLTNAELASLTTI